MLRAELFTKPGQPYGKTLVVVSHRPCGSHPPRNKHEQGSFESLRFVSFVPIAIRLAGPDLVAVDPARTWWDADATVPVGVVLLELAVAAANPEVALHECAHRVARRMVDHDLGRVV